MNKSRRDGNGLNKRERDILKFIQKEIEDRGFAPEFAILTFNSTISCRNVFTFPKSTVFELIFKTAALSLFMRYGSSPGELLPFLLHELHIKIKKNKAKRLKHLFISFFRKNKHFLL